MRVNRLGVCVSVAAFAQLLIASSASAQTAAPPPAAPPAPYAPPPGAPPPGGPPPAPPQAPPPGATPAPYGAYAPPPALQPPFGAPVGGPTVWLRVTNPRARLQVMQLKWVDLCMAPCGRPADPGAMYRIGGGSIKPSPTFRLPRPAGEVRIDAQTGSVVKYWVGVGLSIGGAVSAGGGALYYLGGTGSNTNGLSNDSFRVIGVTYMIVGAVLLAIGLPMWLTNNTTVDVQ